MRRFSVLFLFVTAVTFAPGLAALLPAAEAQEHNVKSIRGPLVSAATFSGGRLLEAGTFHHAGQFVAHILTNPPSRPTGTSPLGGRTVALGHHAAGTTRISLRLGTLKPGRYAVVITPIPQTSTTNPRLAATWVYLTAQASGKIKIKLVTP